MDSLKVNAKVRVYHKPLTREDFEGEAFLVKPINELGDTEYDGEKFQRWEVRFVGKDWTETYQRVIGENDVIE